MFAGWFRPGATHLSLPLSSATFWPFAFGCMHTTGTKNWGNSPGKANGWIEADNQMLTLLHHCWFIYTESPLGFPCGVCVSVKLDRCSKAGDCPFQVAVRGCEPCITESHNASLSVFLLVKQANLCPCSKLVSSRCWCEVTMLVYNI